MIDDDRYEAKNNPRKDDFMNQEQYVIEFPDEAAEAANTDPTFAFDLQFDETGLSGECLAQTSSQSWVLLFRVFKLPLITESYTSTDGSMFYKNADVGQMIIVYDKSAVPAIFEHYSTFMKEQARKAVIQQPYYDVLPSGLTPASARASAFYPEFPSRPKLFEQCYNDQISIEFKEEKDNIDQKAQVSRWEAEITQHQETIQRLQEKRHARQTQLNLEGVSQEDADIRQWTGQINDQRKIIADLEKSIQAAADKQPPKRVRNTKK